MVFYNNQQQNATYNQIIRRFTIGFTQFAININVNKIFVYYPLRSGPTSDFPLCRFSTSNIAKKCKCIYFVNT